MTIVFNVSDGTSIDAECETNNLYKTIATTIASLSAPNNVQVSTPYGDAKFQLISRSGAFFVREEFNNISVNQDEILPTVYLVMVNPEHNNYKFYQLEDDGTNVIATYGRIGLSSNEMFGEKTWTYPRHMYWVKLAEKLAKGYKDMSDVYLTESEASDELDSCENKSETNNSKNDAAHRLYSLLRQYSQYVIKETFISTKITPAMVEKTNDLLNDLYVFTTYGDCVPEDVDAFNEKLLRILEVSPRKVDQVRFLLASSPDDFAHIIQREESLLMAMEAVVRSSQKSSKAQIDGFDTKTIKVHMATEKQVEEVMRHLNDTLRPKVKNVYRVIHKNHKKRFNQYLEDNNIKKVKQLWHGSKNENWLSIIDNGLLLRPNAVITGKMFGDGVYFAPSAMKSWGYTSGHNSYWAKGNSDTAFMGLYAVAYGKPLNVTSPGRYSQAILDSQGVNCVHAHAGTYLKNDEIIFYDEAAMLLNYIVEFNA